MWTRYTDTQREWTCSADTSKGMSVIYKKEFLQQNTFWKDPSVQRRSVPVKLLEVLKMAQRCKKKESKEWTWNRLSNRPFKKRKRKKGAYETGHWLARACPYETTVSTSEEHQRRQKRSHPFVRQTVTRLKFHHATFRASCYHHT